MEHTIAYGINNNLDEADAISERDEEVDISLLNDENLNEPFDFNEDNQSVYSQSSNLDAASSQNNKEIINIGNNFVSTAFTSGAPAMASFIEGFSHLKTDEIKIYIDQFGDGNKEVFNNFQDFRAISRGLNQMDKWRITGLDTAANKNKEKAPKQKKIQILFDFSQEKEITENDFDDFFEKKESKAKKLKEIYAYNNNNNLNKRELMARKKITKKFYNYGIRA